MFELCCRFAYIFKDSNKKKGKDIDFVHIDRVNIVFNIEDCEQHQRLRCES